MNFIKKFLIIFFLGLILVSTSEAQPTRLWKYRDHATDCTSLTDGTKGDMCYNSGSQTMWVCNPGVGLICDTIGEWYQVSGSGAGGGDDVSVNGTSATGANFIDGDIDWTLSTAPSPDTIAATVACTNCVTLTTETVGSYAAGDAEAGNALTGDSATSFFSSGLLEVAIGGNGSAPASGDQILISDSTTATTWKTLPDCIDSGGNHINYTLSTNAWSCGTTSSGGAGAGGWTDTGTDINLSTSTDNVGIGGVSLAKLSVDGDTDEIQLLIQGFSTQNTNLVVFENSAGTDQFSITNAGNTIINGTITSNATGQSNFNQGVVLNSGGGATSSDNSIINGDTLAVVTVTASSDTLTGLGIWDLTSATSFKLPNSAAPTTDAFGKIAGDNNAWAASRGTIQLYDGTANSYVVAALTSDVPTNGQVPKWNTGGTITWENDSSGSGSPGGIDTQLQYNNSSVFSGTNNLTWAVATDSLTLGSTVELDAGGSSSLEIPNAAAPTVDATGEIAVDTTDDQIKFYGTAAVRVIPYEHTACAVIESLVSTDDNFAFYMAGDAITVTEVGCNCRGTCSTLATFTLEDRGGNAMTITGTNPTCATTGDATFAAVTAANSLNSGEMVAFDVTNSPTVSDTYSLCINYTVNAQ